ncbi:MAG: ABC transporter permease [Saprospirales bacterium]|nr:MAG: ABC transporter permease [Saprospirales bacterium]
MRNYLLKRVLLFLPTLFVISLVVFFLSKIIPGDPAERLTGILSIEGEEHFDLGAMTNYQRTYRHLGLDRPLFYFSVHPRAREAHFRDIERPAIRKNIKQLMYETGQVDLVRSYFEAGKALSRDIQFQLDECDTAVFWSDFEHQFNRAGSKAAVAEITNNALLFMPAEKCSFHPSVKDVVKYGNEITSAKRPFGWWIPKLSWHGTQNQYHHWLAGIFSGDWGYSLRDGRSVGSKIRNSIGYTLSISFFSLLLTFAAGIPLGMYLATTKRKRCKELLRTVVYALYAVPLFWLATLLVVFFTTEEYGKWTNLFPSPSQIMLHTMDGDASFFQGMSYLLLPVLCLASGGVAFVARQMEQTALRESASRYIAMSRLKGNSEVVTIWRHLFPNAVFPLITLLGTLIPGLISGSVVIEVIFNIPGMGRLMWDSIFGQDWNVVFAILFIGAILTLVGQLIADILYTRANPKVRYD